MPEGAKMITKNDFISVKKWKNLDEEYSLKLSQSAKLDQIKEDIRYKIRVEIDEEIKQNFVEMRDKDIV